MTALAITANSRIADRVMGAYFRMPVAEGTFREDVAPRFTEDTLALCHMFGMTPVQLCYQGADRRLQFEAFVVNDPVDRRVFLTNHARSPERALIGHELVHRMRRERPDLYNELVDELATAGVDHERWAAFYRGLREQTQRKEGRALSDAEIREEGIADLVGDLILDPTVWRALQRPTLLQRVHDWIRGVWAALRHSRAAVDPLGGASLIRDRGRAMAAVSRVLATWAASLGVASPAEAPEAPMLAAALKRDANAPEGAFRSALLDALVAARGAPVRAGREQWQGWLDGAQRRGEFKKSERDWMGVDAWLEGRGTTTRDELIEFVRAHVVDIQEITLSHYVPGEDEIEVLLGDEAGEGMTREEAIETLADPYRDGSEFDTKFQKYQLPGGRSYRELLLTLPVQGGHPVDRMSRDEMAVWYENEIGYNPIEDDPSLDTEELRNTIRGIHVEARNDGGGLRTSSVMAGFQSRHFDQPNILVHVRFNERTGADGKRVLFLEEIQSDWHQEGRKKGYKGVGAPPEALTEAERAERERLFYKGPDFERTESENERLRELQTKDSNRKQWESQQFLAAPDAPFKATDEWAMLAFKRMVRWAAENGFDQVAWTTGEQQARRYDLSKQIEEVRARKRLDGLYAIGVSLDSGDRNLGEQFTESQLADQVGKELADKIIAATSSNGGDWVSFSGADLRIGGEGMRAFYDKILPSAVNKWARRFGGRVGRTNLGQVQAIRVDDGQFGWEVRFADGQREVRYTEEAAQRRIEEVSAALESADVHALDLTSAMRDAAMSGLPMFRRSLNMLPVEEEECCLATAP